MTPSNHLSLDLSIKLSHLFSECEGFWIVWPSGEPELVQNNRMVAIESASIFKGIYPAPQLHDVITIMPNTIHDDEFRFDLHKSCHMYIFRYYSDCKGAIRLYSDIFPIQAAGKLAVWCVENGHLPKG